MRRRSMPVAPSANSAFSNSRAPTCWSRIARPVCSSADAWAMTPPARADSPPRPLPHLGLRRRRAARLAFRSTSKKIHKLSTGHREGLMAAIVLVHGIDQQQKSADKLESEWLPALAGGLRAAGFPDLADRLWRDAGKPGGIETRMAFYGSLFLAPGQQGDDPGDLTPEEA